MSIGYGASDQMLLEPGAEEVRDGGAVPTPGAPAAGLPWLFNPPSPG